MMEQGIALAQGLTANIQEKQEVKPSVVCLQYPTS